MIRRVFIAAGAREEVHRLTPRTDTAASGISRKLRQRAAAGELDERVSVERSHNKGGG